ncbi:hypothetical protein C7974DRAFT_192707 [Boeremia exigua]|uniref:uncharacterized protein n=1 Tax=Boeremia exigua TaxID=749465 RepID=UPI001E8CFC79|nr:uncharacterized protein C7974DRAFT_192707 [Boeremia exigua]KAH6629746.1 hypothetical protein C7974DRAFT_192707 [Boeremia exigua]
MRTKRWSVCQNCRAKKLACDGLQPACSQCALRNKPCSGYKQNYVFMPGNASNTRLKGKSTQRKGITSARAASAPSTSTSDARGSCHNILSSAMHLITPDGLDTSNPSAFSHTLEDDIRFIVRQYVPISGDVSPKAMVSQAQNEICGAWVDVLPVVAMTRGSEQPLTSAIGTLALVLRYYVLKEHVRHSEILDMYCRALENLGKALADAQGIFHIEHCIAMMCLADADVAAPTLKSGWMMHVKAVGDMMERLGPTPFADDPMHTMFIGFRPLLLWSSMLNRRGAFLMRKEWTTRPFEGQPVSMMQRLLNLACELPALLERFDETIDSLEHDLGKIEHLWGEFCALLLKVQEWEQNVTSETPQPLVWSKCDPNIWPSSNSSALWFPNLMVANSLTHCWGFEIVMRTHLSTLHQLIYKTRQYHPQIHKGMNAEAFEEASILILAEKICDSTPYLLQTKFKFHGLWSAHFTLPTALRVLRQKQEDDGSPNERCRRIESLLADREIYFPDIQQ